MESPSAPWQAGIPFLPYYHHLGSVVSLPTKRTIATPPAFQPHLPPHYEPFARRSHRNSSFLVLHSSLISLPLWRNQNEDKPCNPYLNPYTDFGFKKLFGTEVNKDLLISFINSLLHGREKIKDLTYLNAEHLGVGEADRKAIFDVYCENEQGEKFLVEMQRGEQQYFKDRSLYYATFPIREQAHRGDWNYELKCVYIIGILNFCFDDTDPDEFHHEVQLLNNRTHNVFYDKLTFIYLEMPKFNKTEDQLSNLFEKWLFVLRNLSRLLERPKALQERVFAKLFKAAEIAKFTKEEYDAYEESLKVYRDWKNTIDTAVQKAVKKATQKARKEGLKEGLKEGRAEGLKEGLEEGLEKGRKETTYSIARQMKSEGLPAVTIAKITGLTEDEIDRL